MSKTLLELAKSSGENAAQNKPVSEEEIDLALAWMKNEITMYQVSTAYGKIHKSGNVLYRVALVLRQAYALGRITVKEK